MMIWWALVLREERLQVVQDTSTSWVASTAVSAGEHLCSANERKAGRYIPMYLRSDWVQRWETTEATAAGSGTSDQSVQRHQLNCGAYSLHVLFFNPLSRARAFWIHIDDAQRTVVLEEATVAGARLPQSTSVTSGSRRSQPEDWTSTAIVLSWPRLCS